MVNLDFEDWLVDNYGMTWDEYSREDKQARRQIKQEYENEITEKNERKNDNYYL